MPNIIDILARAQSLMNETALNSITPPRAGGIMYDTLLVLNQMQLEGASLLISKVYASVSAMEADTTPTSDLTGRALKPGQLVVIVTSDASSSDMGSEYRYNGPGSWTYVGKVGGLPLDTEPIQNSTKAITSGAVYNTKQALEGQIDQVDEKNKELDAREKMLEGAYSEKNVIDASSLPNRNYSLMVETGKYGTSNTYKHGLVVVNPGDVVRISASSGYMTRICFVTSTASPTSGGNIPLCAGTSVVQLPAGTSALYSAPADAVAALVYKGQSPYENAPASLSVETPAIKPDGLLDDSKAKDIATAALVKDAVTGSGYETKVIDLSLVPEQNLSIDSNNAYESSGKHSMIECFPKSIVKVTGGGGRVAFVSGVYCPNSGNTVSALETYTLLAGKTYLLRAPEGTIGLIYNTYQGSENVAPTSIEISRPDEQMPNFKEIPASRFTTADGALAYVAYSNNRNYLLKVKAGHRYAVKITADTISIICCFITELPRIGLSYTSISISQNANTSNKENTFSFAPAEDGYYLFRLYKSGGPTFVASSYDVDDYYEGDGEFQELWRLNINDLTKRNYMIDAANGLYGASTTYKHVLVPIRPGQKVKIVKRTNNAAFAWLTSDDPSSPYGVPAYVPGTCVIRTEGGIFTAPAGTKFLWAYTGDANNSYWPSYIAVSVDYDAMPDIVVDNDYDKTRRLLFQLKSTTRAENDVPYKPLTLVHYSDIHGQKVCQNRINEFREFWKDYIDDTIQTGDLVTSYWGDGSAFDEEIAPADNPSRNILSVIGNHDVASKNGSDFVWHTYQGKQAYDRYIAPFIDYWGNVVQPEGASENGYCFYYKDYPDSKIRLVVLDTFNNDDAYEAFQQTWFAGVLADAISEGLSVIVASHFRIKCEALLKSPFTMPWAAVENLDSSVCNDPYIPLVKEFIDNGGELVCWITGHSHYDAISKTSEENGSQINICVNRAGAFGSKSTSLWETNSFINIDFSDWKTFDCFNVMAVDTHYKFITLFRVGSNRDKMGRLIETCCIRYKTGEILYP